MDPEALRTHLAALHAELGRVERVDPQSAQLLAEIVQDIKRLMDRPPEAAVRAATASGTRAPPPSITERLETVAVQFEVDHPTLAASSRRLMDLLVKAGL